MKTVMKKWTYSTTCLLIWALLCSVKLYAASSHDALFEVLLDANSHPYFQQPLDSSEQAKLKKLYQLNENQLLWFSSEHPVKTINQLLELYAAAPTQGLNSDDYAYQYLKSKWLNIQQSNPDFYQFAVFDTALSLTFIRYLKDLHYGRVAAKLQGFRLDPKKNIDLASAIYGAIQIGALDSLVADLEPQLKPYQQLKTALVKYRRLAQQFKQPLHFALKESLHPGDWSSEVSKLRLHLNALSTPIGQAIEPSIDSNNVYTEDLVIKVKALQTQHGQLNDGIIGKQTLATLNTPFEHRVEQIELAMERLRWISVPRQSPFILVNIPAFQLWAFNTEEHNLSDPLTMRVIVGKAKNRIKPYEKESKKKALQTPIFTAKLSYLVFNPYWNIPESILLQEILPLLEQDPDYLQKNNMEIVSRFAHDAPVYALNETNIQRLYNKQLHLRQRPGRKNALGHIKFIFPNNHNIYLHDTPARSLFKRSKRDFSHGCIRVENPNILAEFVLSNQSEWNATKIKQTMRSNKPSIVDVKQKIPVLIFYSTALPSPAGIAFYPDIYDHDSALTVALDQRSKIFATVQTPLLVAF
ncbi:L,D-transpeptidase family protein [Methyloprofundus sp.]|uniref:L,D-transpeptidase family protein n=1 Tax=Methyloprofundus sp. TaxID=2020875 RepID=UPI003D144DB9